MKTIKTDNYNIYFSTNTDFNTYLKNYTKIFVLTDDIVKELCFNKFVEIFAPEKELNLITIEHGEINKTLDSCSKIWSELSKKNADRKSLLINLGGGVITDMGGFCASVFKRGIDFINIPTTLLSQVDASVGGKTGIDFNGLKNNIGVFSDPIAVYINTTFLKTLDHNNMISGYAEMLKHSLIKSEALFEDLKTLDLNNLEKLADYIYQSVQIKYEVVKADPFEKNIRKVLNLGHTLGHGVESSFLKKKVFLHGEAVAIGLIGALYLSAKFKGFDKKKLNEITAFIISIYGKHDIDLDEVEKILGFMKNDKKNSQDKINFVLLNNFGDYCLDVAIDKKSIEDAIDFYRDF